MGLARTTQSTKSVGMGIDGLSARRIAGAFGTLARLSGAEHDPPTRGRRT